MNRQQRRESARQSAKSTAAPPLRSDAPAAFFEAGLRLLQAGQIAEAEQCGRRALAIDAGHADSLHLMGMLCFASQQHDLAIEWFAQAIRQNPEVADYFANLGGTLRIQGRLDEAIKCYDRALVLNPALAETWYKLGEILQQQKRLDEALLSFDQASKVDPDYLEAVNASALVHFEAGRYDAAIAGFDRSLAIDPGLAGALHLKGICQLRLKRFEAALANCSRALALAPDHPEITNNVGLVLQKLDRNQEALLYFDKAIALKPDFALAFNHRGTSLSELRRFDEALLSFASATAINPDYADAHWNRALIQLLIGDFAGGWAAREWGRKSIAVGFVDRQFTQPVWRGETPLTGKTILLHSDEGLGDTIQFSRYVAEVARLGARVVLEVQDVLHPLLSEVEGVSLCLPKTAVTLPEFDLHCPLSSLPLAFGTRLETIPSALSYLPTLPEDRVQEWERRLGPRDRLRVGLVWSGNPGHGNDRNRSMSLREMSAITDVDAAFYSLQKDPRPDDKAMLLARGDIIDFTEHFAGFVDTAALMACLDLVITVDTSVAHLAGALGRPTWIVLPYTPDYRWLLDRDDSPWYPTVRLFRQDERRNYADVLARVRTELQRRIAAASDVTET
ncbi:tetratricopeptide repeat protein [Bradyrhizobium sp.]|uniref:tetratricopeptide repeat protein n=1 Tax=Bradyrhizobium sp. TaxID=376 RepID=UPI003C522D8B